ncbi:hypothetical protein PAEPH01_1716 [Pancytospora epiphaga]|nr:hypothetical protein PAEPH01_1716 [Pancytospora epiphaga]
MNRKKNEEFNKNRTGFGFEEEMPNEVSGCERKASKKHTDDCNFIGFFDMPLRNTKVFNKDCTINDETVSNVYSLLGDDSERYKRYKQQNGEHYEQVRPLDNEMGGRIYENHQNTHRASWDETDERALGKRVYENREDPFAFNSFYKKGIREENNDLYEARGVTQNQRNLYGVKQDHPQEGEIREGIFEGDSIPKIYREDQEPYVQGSVEGMRYKRIPEIFNGLEPYWEFNRMHGTSCNPVLSKRNESDSYRVVTDAVMRIQSVFENMYGFLHEVIQNLSTGGGFGPYTETMASQLEAFRNATSKAIYPPEDRSYYQDVELKYRRGFEGRKQNSFYKSKYQMFYEENKNAEAVKHLARIDVKRKEKREK